MFALFLQACLCMPCLHQSLGTSSYLWLQWWAGGWYGDGDEDEGVGTILGVLGACSKCSSTLLLPCLPISMGSWGHAGPQASPPSHLSPYPQHEEASSRNHSLVQRVQDLEHRYSEASTLQHIQATLLYDMQAQINNISVLTDWAWRNPTCLGPAEMRLQEEMHHAGDGKLLGWMGWDASSSLKGTEGKGCGETALNLLCIGQESDLTQPVSPRQPGGLLGAMDTSRDGFHAV